MKKLLKKLALLSLAIVFMFNLVGCNNKKYTATIKVYNWGDYIDPSIVEDFEKKYNIKVVYDDFATNEEMYAKIKAGADDYDVLFPSDYIIEKMIQEDMLHKIDFSNIPNYKDIEDRFKNLAYDPKNEYSVPYMWGTVGILYNKTMVNETVDSWDILWDAKYKKQILMLDSLRDSIGITLKKLGYSLNTKSDAELEKAKQELIKQRPLVLAYVGDEVKDKMIGGEAALSVVWSGDAVYMMRENEDLAYAIPKEGTNIWFDSMVIPKTSKNTKEAEMFINYLCETDVAFKNTEFIGYATPLSGVKKKLPSELTSNKSIYPDADDLKSSEVFYDLSNSISKYDKIWTEVKAK